MGWVLVPVVVVVLVLAKTRNDASDIRAKPQFSLNLQQDCRLPVGRSRFGW